MRGLPEGLGVYGVHIIRTDQATVGTEAQVGRKEFKGDLYCDLSFREIGPVDLSISPSRSFAAERARISLKINHVLTTYG